MKIERFEDIEAWKLGRELSREIYAMTRPILSSDRSLADQMRRAAVSITSNIAEGFERGGDREFVHALTIAKGSCGELRSQLYVALDENYLSQTRFDDFYQQTTMISRLIAGFIKYLQSSELRGTKFRRGTKTLDTGH